MKVYCKNCQFDRSSMGVEFLTCRPIDDSKVVEAEHYFPGHKTKEESSICRMSELNRNNNCPYYKRKRKWWKRFFVQGE